MRPFLAGNVFVTLNKKTLIDLIGLLLIALVVVVGYKLSPMLLPHTDLSVAPDAACDLQQAPCRVALPGGGAIVADVSLRPIPLVRPFSFELQVEGVAVDAVEVDFSGMDMSMGFNRPLLKALGNGRFSADVTLPVCVTGRMLWQATVLLDTARGRMGVPLRFTTGA